MIVDPITVNDSVPTAHNFARLSINGTTSEWVDVVNTGDLKFSLRVAHRASGKGGTSLNSLFSVKVERRNTVTGLWEQEVYNFTSNKPKLPLTITATDRAHAVAMILSFFASGANDKRDRFYRGEA